MAQSGHKFLAELSYDLISAGFGKYLLKPTVSRNVPADRNSIERVVGHALAKLFIPSDTIPAYGVVLVFDEKRVVLGNQLQRAIEKHSVAESVTLAAGADFSVEARALAKQMNCEILSLREFGWTDESYLKIRQPRT